MLDNLTHMVDCKKAECAVRADYIQEMGRIEKMEGGVDKINRTAASWRERSTRSRPVCQKWTHSSAERKRV